ncbi:MAG: NAD-dependent epimerase/dehydratase family protein [Sinimarinibacterium sp.]
MNTDLGIDRIAQPVLVTGANGFLGTHLVRRFIRAGIRPRAFILAGTPVPAEWHDAVEIVRGDITDAKSVRTAAQGCRTILHLAALVTDWGTREAHRRVTLEGTENVFAAAAQVRARVVLVSSVVVYADRIGAGPCHEGLGFGRPRGPYGWAKQRQELTAQRYRGRVDYSIVRPANIYGPGCGPWLRDVVEVLRMRVLPTLVNGGNGNAGLVHVENVADLVLLAAWHPRALGEAFNAADELPVTWRTYIGDIARLAGTRPPGSTPAWLALPTAALMEWIWGAFGIRHRPPVTREALALVGNDNQFPQRKAREVLGYRPRIGYAEGMDTVARSLKAESSAQ